MRKRVADFERVVENRGDQRDFTERDAAFRRLFEHSREAMYITAVDGTVLEANQALLDLFGYRADELIGGDVRWLYDDPNQRGAFQAEIEAKGSLKDFPIKFRKKNGTEIDCLLTSTVRRENGDRVVGYEGIIRDVSEQQLAEQMLRQTTESFHALLDAAPDSAFLLDRDGKFIALNRETARQLGYLVEDLRGKSSFEVIAASLAKSRRDRLEEVIRERRPLSFEDEHHGRYFSMHLCPVLDESGDVSSVAAYAREITEAKLIEQQLWKAHGELEALVEERTAELVRSNQALREGIAERRKAESNLAAELRKFRVLYALAVHLTTEHSLDENLSLVVEHSRKLLSADTSYIALRDPRADDVYMHTLSGINSEAFKSMRIPFGKGLGGIVAKTGKGIIVNDYFEEMEPLLHDVVREEGLVSGLAVPIQSGQVNLGVLYAFNRTRTDFSESDLETLSLLGNLAAVEITRKRAQQELRQAQEFLELQVEQRTAQLKKANAKLILEITEREKVEEALRRNRQMLDNILTASPLGISYVKKGRLKWTNQTMILMFGYPEPVDYMDKNMAEFYTSQEEYQRVRAIFLKDLKAGKPTEVEALFKRADGSNFYGQLRIRALDPSNPGDGTISTISDISDRKRAEEALRQSEEKYRTIIENIEDLYYEVDLDGTFTFVNDAIARTLGYTKEELIGRNYLSRSNPTEASRTFTVFNKVFRTGESVRAHEMSVEAKDGTHRHMEVSVSAIRDTAGKVTGFRGICRDVTDRKRAAEELLKFAKLESIGVLAGGIAHDFNNILTAILGNISLARLYVKPDDKAFQRLKEAERAGVRARDLIQQLLTFSKGGSPIKRIASIPNLVRESCEFALRGSNVRCEFEIADDVWAADVDEVQISQVLGNIVINADQAMPQGGSIHVTARNVDVTAQSGLPLPPGKYIQISISDYGVGIPAEILPNIFDPYFTTKSEGSGLGLATAYSIMKGHGGRLTVESEVDKGSMFHIYLPASPKKLKPRQDSEYQALSGCGRILVMDDEQPIRDLAGELLEMLGYDVVTAADGSQAVELYRLEKDSDRPFDVIILDLTVPGGMGGREAIEQLRRLDPDIKAIVSSGYSNDPIMADYERYGFSGVIPKPYGAQQLSEVLNSVISPKNA